MIEGIFSGISRFLQQFAFWYVVEPWQQCLRVRAGKYVKRIPSGIHLRIPYVDSIHKQSSRYRTALCSPQTLTTIDGHTVVCSFALGYALDDIEKLYQTLSSADGTLTQTVASFVADAVSKVTRDSLSAVTISSQITETLSEEFEQYGLKDITVRLQDFAFIKAFRLIQDQRWNEGTQLTTENYGVPR